MNIKKQGPKNAKQNHSPATLKAKNYKQDRIEFFVVLVFFLLGLAPEAHNKMSFADDGVWNQVVWASFYVFAAFRIYSMKMQAFFLISRSLPLLGFCALMLLSTFWSVAPSITFIESIELSGSAMIGLYVVLKFPISSFLKIFLLKFLFVATTSLLVIVLSPGRGRDDFGAGPWSGILPDKNSLGAEMALALVLLLSFSVKSAKLRLAVIFSALLFSGLLLGSNSATAATSCFGSIGIILAAIFLRSKSTSNGVRISVITTLALAALGLLIFGFKPDSLLGLIGRSPNLTGRTDFWPYLQQAIADRPLLGFGYGAFFASSVGVDYLSTYIVQAGGWSPFHAHNSFFQIALDAGYFGVTLFAVALASALFQAVKLCFSNTSPESVYPLSIIIYLLIGSFTETSFARFNTDLWILFIAAALYPMRNSKLPDSKTAYGLTDGLHGTKS